MTKLYTKCGIFTFGRSESYTTDEATAHANQQKTCVAMKECSGLKGFFGQGTNPVDVCPDYQYTKTDFCAIGATNADGSDYHMKKDNGWGDNYEKVRGYGWCKTQCDATPECKSFTYRPKEDTNGGEDSFCYYYSDKHLSELLSGPGWNKSKQAGTPYDESDCHGFRQYVKVE